MASKARSAIEEVTHQARALAAACHIQTGLAGIYHGVLSEPIPRRFTDLLSNLGGGQSNGRTVPDFAAHVDTLCGCGCDIRGGLRMGDMAQREEE